ncbi:MAG: hypothetical protein R3D44_14415 [Hyphomicrobiaceae bacterium]
MCVKDRKLRIALAVFDLAGPLGSAIASLLREGIPIGRLGLILQAATAERLAADASRASPGDGASMLDLVRKLTPLSQAYEGRGILASPRLLEPWRSGSRLPALWGDAPSGGEAPRLAADLERNVQDGAVILAAETANAREQWLCTRLLLQQSSSIVLALECSLPPAAASG